MWWLSSNFDSAANHGSPPRPRRGPAAVLPKNDLGKLMNVLGKRQMKLSLSKVIARWLLGSLVLVGTGCRSSVRVTDTPQTGTQQLLLNASVEAGSAAYGTDSHTAVFGITETDQLPEINVCVGDTQFGVAKLSMFARERESGVVIWHSGPMRADGYQRMRKRFGLGPFFDGTVEHPTNRVRRLDSGTVLCSNWRFRASNGERSEPADKLEWIAQLCFRQHLS